MKKTYFNWSTGKDAALAFYHLQKNTDLSIEQLVTTINAHHDRITMHGLRRSLYLQQLQSVGLPHSTIELPEQPSMETYNQLMQTKVDELKAQGFTDCGFGDIFLEDLRAYREKQLHGIQCHFPLWKRDTRELFMEFLNLGFKAVVICINGDALDESFVGRELDLQFLKDLPEDVDPCGENGEFHTFCYDGPIFNTAVDFELGEKVVGYYDKPNTNPPEKTSYWFMDLLPKESR